MGRAALSLLPDADVRERLDASKLDKLTPKTVTSKRKLLELVSAVGADGLFLLDQELHLGLRALAVPLTVPSGIVVAAVGLSVLAHRVSAEAPLSTYLPALGRGARQMRRHAGGPAQPRTSLDPDRNLAPDAPSQGAPAGPRVAPDMHTPGSSSRRTVTHPCPVQAEPQGGRRPCHRPWVSRVRAKSQLSGSWLQRRPDPCLTQSRITEFSGSNTTISMAWRLASSRAFSPSALTGTHWSCSVHRH